MNNTDASDLVLCELEDPGLAGVESYSPFCLKVHRALRVAGLRYQRRHASRPDAFSRINPRRQVPVLLVGSEPVADSTRIVERIDALSGGALIPQDARQRAEAILWEELADTSVNGFVVAARWADERNWPITRAAYFSAMPALVRAVIPGRIRARVVGSLHARDVWRAGPDACWDRFRVTLDQLDARAPTHGFWLGGERVTSADLALFGQLHSLRTPLTPWQSQQLAERATLSAYLDRVHRATCA